MFLFFINETFYLPEISHFFLSAVILYRNSWFPEVCFPWFFLSSYEVDGVFPSYYLGDGICKIWCRYLWSSEDDKQPSHFPILFIGSLSLFHPRWECPEVREGMAELFVQQIRDHRICMSPLLCLASLQSSEAYQSKHTLLPI